MNLIDQVFAQQQSGSANGAGFGQFFAEGVQQGQRQQQLNMELAQLPLKQTLLQQDAQLNSLRIEQGLKARQDDIVNDAAWGGLSGMVTEKLHAGDLPGARAAYVEGNSKTPSLWIDPRSIQLGRQLDQMENRENTLKAAQLRAKGAEFRALPMAAKYQAQLQEAQAGLDEALANGDTESADFYQKQVEFNQGQIKLASDKLKTEQDRIAAEDRRTQATNARTALSAPQQARLKSIYKEIDRKKEERDGLPEQVGLFSKSPNPKRAALDKRIAELEAEAEKLGGGSAATPTQEKFEIGKTYVDGQGNKAIYRGDGNWTPLP